MKKHFLLLLTLLFGLNCYSQIKFEKGYYIDNSNQKIDCFIKNIDWKNNPTQFMYKQSENSEIKTATIQSVKEFVINNSSQYIRSNVQIDRSSEDLERLDDEEKPKFKQETLFLKKLISGKANLYQYTDGNLIRFFYNKENGEIKQLVYKIYHYNDPNDYDNDGDIAYNNLYKQQLWNDLKCKKLKKIKFEELEYTKTSLVKLFTEYSVCSDKNFTKLEKKKRNWFNLNIRPGLNNSSLSFKNRDSKSVKADNKTSFRFGIEAEYIFPFNKNKWAIAIEPTYHMYKSKVNNTNLNNIISNIEIDYSSIEIPISLRHYFFLNDNSKLFVNASYIFNLDTKSEMRFNRLDGSSLRVLNFSPLNNYAFGLGYKHNDRYSAEIRYQSDVEFFGNLRYWNSEYKTISLIFGYTLF